MEARLASVASHVLQSNHWLLCSVLEVSHVLPGAVAVGLLSEEEGRAVEIRLSEQGCSAGIAKMLELLLLKHQNDAFNRLLEVLEEKEELKSWAAYLRSKLTYFYLY